MLRTGATYFGFCSLDFLPAEVLEGVVAAATVDWSTISLLATVGMGVVDVVGVLISLLLSSQSTHTVMTLIFLGLTIAAGAHFLLEEEEEEGAHLFLAATASSCRDAKPTGLSSLLTVVDGVAEPAAAAMRNRETARVEKDMKRMRI